MSTGSYVLLNKHENGTKAFLSSPVFKTNSICEIRIFVYISGDSGEFNIYRRIYAAQSLLYSKKSRIGEYWERILLHVNDTEPFQIIIEGVSGGDYGNYIKAIDDTSFDGNCDLVLDVTFPTMMTTTTTERISTEKCDFKCASDGQCISIDNVCDFKPDCDDSSDERDCGTCNFEESWCGWRDNSDNELFWDRRTGASNNPAGPQVDHTLQTTQGSYLTIDFTDALYFIDAFLLGPRFGELSEYCTISLWVHMGTVSNLKPSMIFFLSKESDLSNYKILDSIDGPLGTNWKQFKIPIGASPPGYVIEVFAFPIYSSEYEYSDIAIDDVTFENCAANTIPRNKSLNCNFDKDFCDYYKDTTGEFNWKRSEGSSIASSNGLPISDRKLNKSVNYNFIFYIYFYISDTSGLGFFIYSDSTKKEKDSARIFSSIQDPKLICLSFWCTSVSLNV